MRARPEPYTIAAGLSGPLSEPFELPEENVMRRGTLISLLLLVLVLVLMAPVPAVAAPADLKAAVATRLKALKDFAKQRRGVCDSQIAAVEGQVRTGLTTAANGLESITGIAGVCIADVLAKAIDARLEITDTGEMLLAGGDTVTGTGFLVGDASLLDQFAAKLNDELDKFRKGLVKRLRSYAAAITKSTTGTFRHTVVIPTLRMEVAPVPNNPAISSTLEDIIYPSRLFVIMAGSSTASPSDGKVCLAGRAFLTIGSEKVNVALVGPGNPAPKLNVTIGNGTGYWQTCFTALSVGNFRVLIDQDPNHDTIFVETPTEYSAIGVP